MSRSALGRGVHFGSIRRDRLRFQLDHLPHEESVFVDLIEDVLRATPRLRYHLHLTEAQKDDGDASTAGSIDAAATWSSWSAGI